MKAYSKNRLTVAQRDTIHKTVAKEFEKYKSRYEQKCNDRIFFLFFLSLAIVLDEKLHFGEQRRGKVLKACIEQITDISDYLVSNTCETQNGNERYDTEYNLATLERLAKQYHIEWNEDIFNDDIESEG